MTIQRELSWKKIISSYLVVFITFTAIFLLLFHLDLNWISKIFFYKGITLLGITSFICLAGIIFYGKKTNSNFETLIAAFIISIAVNLSIFIVFPVTFERSVTVFMLSTLSKGSNNPSCPGLTKKQLDAELINTYVVKNDAIGKRIKEQEVIDIVNKRSQCVQLTNKGVSFLKFSHIMSKLYNL